jgi:hypothetical protein
MSKDYVMAVQNSLTQKSRWENGIEHHPMSLRLMKFLLEWAFST